MVSAYKVDLSLYNTNDIAIKVTIALRDKCLVLNRIFPSFRWYWCHSLKLAETIFQKDLR